jgi:uncharacterized protein
MLRVGLISDTHGLLRPEALACLRGADHIVHAGDIGGPQILEALAAEAPLTAVRGNNDSGPWAAGLRETEVLQLGEVLIYVIHDRTALDVDAAAAGFHAVVCGHSHRPACEKRDGVLFVNPGSAGPRRFKLPVCVGELRITAAGIEAELVELSVTS